MRPDEPDKAYLWDMLDAARAVAEFVRDRTFQDYLSNRMLRGAVERHIEIVGEAARRVSEETRQAHPEIPWHAIVGQRNVLAHEYDQVLHEAIWGIATGRLSDLIASLRAILPEDEGNE